MTDPRGNTYRINAGYAVAKAKEAVANWKAGLEKARKIGTAEDIRFCEDAVRGAEKRLAEVRRDVEDNWTAYL